jgi:hypothetical protein
MGGGEGQPIGKEWLQAFHVVVPDGPKLLHQGPQVLAEPMLVLNR